MNDMKLFVEELKFLVEKDLVLNPYITDQLQERFEKEPELINRIYKLLLKNKPILSVIYDIEAAIYDWMVKEEMDEDKTFYGATMHVAELFDTTQTYIKSKVIQSNKRLQIII